MEFSSFFSSTLMKRNYINSILYLSATFILCSVFLYKESECINNRLRGLNYCSLIIKKLAYRGGWLSQRSLAEEYYENGNYNKAFKWYKKVLQQGNSDVYYDVGNIFIDSESIRQVFKKNIIDQLIKWHKKSAEKGDTKAQKFLVNMYCSEIFPENRLFEKWYREWKKKGWITINCLLKEKKLSTPKNKKDKLDLYKKLALEGYTQAQYELGELLEKDRKRSEAIKWYKKAALKGNAEAQYRLALKLMNKNKMDESIKWLNQSDLYWKSPKTRLDAALIMDHFKDKYHISDRKFQNQIFNWYKKSVVFEDSKAEYFLASHYFYGKYVDKDIKTGLELYKKSAERGYKVALLELGKIYSKGKIFGLERNDPEEAIKWFKKLVAIHSSYKCHVCHEAELIIEHMGFLFFINNLKTIYEF